MYACSNSCSHLHVQWIPGHCGIEGNEIADHYAKLGGEMIQTDVPIDLTTAKANVRRHARTHLWEPRLVHESIRGRVPPPPERDKEDGLSRRERTIMSQLRCDANSPILQSYLNKIGKADDDKCLNCGTSPDNLEHALWSCPAGDLHRHHLPMTNSRKVLWDFPVQVIAYLQDSGRLPRSAEQIPA